MKIFFDLDGTLLNSMNRMYGLFRALVPEVQMNFDGYWNLKRSGKTHYNILKEMAGLSEKDIDMFEKEWMRKIESEEWLSLDVPYDGAGDLLEKLANQNEVYIVTARQHEEMVVSQLKQLGWLASISDLFVTNQKRPKADMIRGILKAGDEGWMIGDTCEDIAAGKKAGLRTVAMAHGFRGKDTLSSSHPDFMADSIGQLEKILLS